MYIILPNYIHTMSSGTNVFDTTEKVDILIKSAFGFPSADEDRAWYEETVVPFNDYIIGENILIDVVPSIPDFNINGIVRTAAEIDLSTNAFVNYYDNSANKNLCSIVDDSTGVVRRFQLLILEETPQLNTPGASWYKRNHKSVNVIKDAFQFNYKNYTDANSNLIQPYLYIVNTQKSISAKLPFGKLGGNWFIDLKSGILFFADFNNFSNGTQETTKFQVNTTDNKPVLTIYTYIGRKGTPKIVDFGNITYKNTLVPKNNQLFVNTTDNTIQRYDGTQWISVGGAGGGTDTSSINLKADKSYVDLSLNLKPSFLQVDASLNEKANTVSPSFTGVVNAVKMQLSSDVSFNNNVDIGGNLVISSDININNKLYVNGNGYFNGRVDICGNFYAQYPPNSIPANAIIGGVGNINNTGCSCSGGSGSLTGSNITFYDNFVLIKEASTQDLSLSGNLVISGDVSLNSKLRVANDVSLNNNVDISGNLVIKGLLSIFHQF